MFLRISSINEIFQALVRQELWESKCLVIVCLVTLSTRPHGCRQQECVSMSDPTLINIWPMLMTRLKTDARQLLN